VNPLETTLLPDSLLVSLRALRLWHWKECLKAREAAKHVEFSISKKLANREADFHLKQVQLLNEFFETGDTAERNAQ